MRMRALAEFFRASSSAGASRAGCGALLRERAGRAVLRAGWPGIVGVALLVLASAFGYASRIAAEERRIELADERARLLRGDVREAPAVSERERLDAFYGRFPRAADLPARLRHLHDHASVRGVDLPRTEYRSATEAGTPLLQVTLSIPVETEFDALYDWLAELLREMPEVALESLQVERAASDTNAVAAELRLQLYLRERS